MCDRIRSVDNVFAVGEACSDSDVIGDAALDGTGAPTAASTLLLGRAEPSLATPTDFFGCMRTAPPDIGAIEFGGCPAPAATALLPAVAAVAAATLSAQPRAKLRARIASVRARRLARRVVVVVRAGNALRVRVAVVAKGRIVSEASRAGSAGGPLRFAVRAPRSGRIVVRVRATGAGGGAVRTIALGEA